MIISVQKILVQSKIFFCFFIFLFCLQACSPMPKASYGFIADIKEEQNLNDMEIDIEIGNIFETSYRCNRESFRQGEYIKTLFLIPLTLGLIGGCVWVGGYSPLKIDKCWGFSTKGNLEHELQHCKGYRDHPLFR